MRMCTASLRFLCAAATIASLTLSLGVRPASADQVSGKVTVDGKPAGNVTLVVRASKSPATLEVQTSASGGYSVFLEPGRYQVCLKTRPEEVLGLDSFTTPATRDLAFKGK